MIRKTLTIAIVGSMAVLAARCMTVSSPFEDGLTFYRNGEFRFAADAFNEAVRQNPNSAAAYVNRGVTRVRLGMLNAAIEDFNRAVQLAPSDPEIYFDRGNALVTAGHYEAAVDDFTRAVELNPAFAKAWFNRGTARALAGQLEAAMQDWRHAAGIESDPWARSAMRRSAGLDRPVIAAGPTPAPGIPTTAGTVAPPPPPGMATGAVPLPPPATIAKTPMPSPAASPVLSPQSIDARALATRAMSRELDGDHEGALQDLRAAIALETDPGRRESLRSLLRRLEMPR